MRSSKEAWKIEFLLGYRDIGVSPCTTRVFMFTVRAIDIHKILRRNESFKQLFRFQGSPRHGHDPRNLSRNENSFSRRIFLPRVQIAPRFLAPPLHLSPLLPSPYSCAFDSDGLRRVRNFPERSNIIRHWNRLRS